MSPVANFDLSFFFPSTWDQGAKRGLEARLADPLWLLARQFQLGAFQAEDAGSPAIAEASVEAEPLKRYTQYNVGPLSRPGDYNPATLPLEAVVEREREVHAFMELGLLDRVEAGAYFLRLLAAYGAWSCRTAYLARYPLALPPEEERARWDAGTRRRLELMARGLLDPQKLSLELSAALGPRGEKPNGALPAEPDLHLEARPRALEAARAWLRWCASRGLGLPTFGQAPEPSTWVPERLEYAFKVSATLPGAEVTLSAPEYAGGRLDWPDFVISGFQKLSALPGGQTTAVPRRLIPTPVTYRGMPSARFWEFEDAEVRLGELTAGFRQLLPSGLKGILLDFAMLHANDWFLVPVELDVGVVCRIRDLTVQDTFGQRIRIPSVSALDGPNSPWRMYTLSPGRDVPPAEASALFFVAPALGPGLESAPVEEVHFFRDEMANLAWAVEHVVEGLAGERLDREAAFRQAERGGVAEARATARADTLRYRLGTRVPEHWVPLMPETREGGAGRLMLRSASIERPGGIGGAQGRLVGGGSLLLFGEEVPREGAWVTRAYQYARWSDGSAHLWIGRRKRPGRGEGYSGLRFDLAEPA